MPSGKYVRILAQDSAASQEEHMIFVQFRRIEWKFFVDSI